MFMVDMCMKSILPTTFQENRMGGGGGEGTHPLPCPYGIEKSVVQKGLKKTYFSFPLVCPQRGAFI